MAWFKMHEGAHADIKWPVIARRAEVSRCVVLAVWWALLDHASSARTRGDVSGFDPETIDALYDLPDGTSARVCQAMIEKGLIGEGRIANWEKRQVADPTARERKERYKARSGETEEPEAERPGNGSERFGTEAERKGTDTERGDREDKIRGEKKRKEKKEEKENREEGKEKAGETENGGEPEKEETPPGSYAEARRNGLLLAGAFETVDRVAITLPLRGGVEYGVTRSFCLALEKFYALDIGRELRAMRDWMVRNPGRSPAPANIRKFIGDWMDRHKAGAVSPKAPVGREPEICSPKKSSPSSPGHGAAICRAVLAKLRGGAQAALPAGGYRYA